MVMIFKRNLGLGLTSNRAPLHLRIHAEYFGTERWVSEEDEASIDQMRVALTQMLESARSSRGCGRCGGSTAAVDGGAGGVGNAVEGRRPPAGDVVQTGVSQPSYSPPSSAAIWSRRSCMRSASSSVVTGTITSKSQVGSPPLR